MSLRSLAAVGALAASALVLAAAPSLLPQASARSDRPGVELAWASGTPAFLTPGGDAALQVTITTGERPEPDSGVVTLELGQATVAGLPPQCRTSGVRPTSSVRADGHLLVCNVGSLPAGVSVPVALTVRPEDTASQVGIQLGDYDNQGTVLTRPVASPAGSPVASPAASPVVPTVASAAAAPYYRLLSSPDFLNADIADLRASSWDRWAPGRPNSWNPAYERALDQVLDDWADFDPDAVTVPGDLVNGRWLRDPDHTGSFGPVDSPSRRTKAVVRAANTYYGAWGQRFLDHDLTVHAGVGDHDLGDNPWRGISARRREAGPGAAPPVAVRAPLHHPGRRHPAVRLPACRHAVRGNGLRAPARSGGPAGHARRLPRSSGTTSCRRCPVVSWPGWRGCSPRRGPTAWTGSWSRGTPRSSGQCGRARPQG